MRVTGSGYGHLHWRPRPRQRKATKEYESPLFLSRAGRYSPASLTARTAVTSGSRATAKGPPEPGTAPFEKTGEGGRRRAGHADRRLFSCASRTAERRHRPLARELAALRS